MTNDHNNPDSLPPVVLGPLEVDDEPAEETPRPQPLPYRRRPAHVSYELSSRELMLGWCAWLLTSWMLLGMGIDGTPIRWMIFASCVGMMIAWPVYRLSQDGTYWRHEHELHHGQPPAPDLPVHTHLTPGLIFRDWFALNCVFQAVVWPHILPGRWTFPQAAWISMSVGAWSLLVAALVAWGCRPVDGTRRTTAMLLILLLLFGEPVVLALANDIGESTHVDGMDWPMHISPIEAIYSLTVPGSSFEPGAWMLPVACVALAGMVLWATILKRPRKRTM